MQVLSRAICLPNGKPLRWKHLSQQGPQYAWRGTIYPAKINECTAKKDLPLLGSRSQEAAGQIALFYDFDAKDMPEGMTEDEAREKAWHFAQAIEGVMFYSYSGMPKVAVVVETFCSELVPHTAKMQQYFMEALLNATGYAGQLHWWDRATTAAIQCFVSKESAELLSTYLPHAKVWTFAEVTHLSRAEWFDYHERIISEEEFLKQYPLPPISAQVLRKIGGHSDLLNFEGAELPAKLLANWLKLPSYEVYKCINILTELGMLEQVSPPLPGSRSSEYVALGDFRGLIRYYRKQAWAVKGHKPLPEVLEDGASFAQLRDATWHFENTSQFMEWVQKVEPQNRNFRWEKALSIARWHYERGTKK
jgi:hypothetical protein